MAFRFPKGPREIKPNRANFLKEFSKVSPITLPTIEINQDKESNTYYEVNKFIPGVSFYPEVAQSFTKEELLSIAKDLGDFLIAVHSFPVEDARSLGIDEMNPNDFGEYMEQNENSYPKFKNLVFPYIVESEQVWVEKIFTDYLAMIKAKPFVTKVIHSDMWVFHIIVDPNTHQLSGVIDFGPRIADPANDFKAFEYYGSDFVKEVYRNYTLPIDDNFEKRRLFYTAHDEVFEISRSIESGDKEKIIKSKSSLSDYIKKHNI